MLGDILFFRILKEVSEDKAEKRWGERTALAETASLRNKSSVVDYREPQRWDFDKARKWPDGKKELPYRSRRPV